LLDLLAMQRGLPAPDLRSITSSASAGLTVTVEAWDATGQTYRRWRSPLACTAFAVAVAEKPAGQFMIRNWTRVVKRHPEGDW
jgi:hypothetical protein